MGLSSVSLPVRARFNVTSRTRLLPHLKGHYLTSDDPVVHHVPRKQPAVAGSAGFGRPMPCAAHKVRQSLPSPPGQFSPLHGEPAAEHHD